MRKYFYLAAAAVSVAFFVLDVGLVLNPNLGRAEHIWSWIGVVLWAYNSYNFFRLFRAERDYERVKVRVEEALEKAYADLAERKQASSFESDYEWMTPESWDADAAEENPLVKE